jgi:hypothetical protein
MFNVKNKAKNINKNTNFIRFDYKLLQTPQLNLELCE